MAEKFKFTRPDGSVVTTDSPEAAIQMRYAHGYTEAPRSTKVDAATDDAKAAEAKAAKKS